GNLFRYRQQWQQAVSMYEQLLAISPRHPQGQLYLASSHLQLQQAEQAAVVLIALCNPAITQTEAYQSMVIQALRSCPEKVQHKGLQAVIDQTINTKNDQALLAYFQRHQAAVIAEQQRR
ncbi:MAG: tetratricopeptide repeat protein, partial [Flavobacteriales bacterium]|nr:tetratricopeptide repeat protein [Flavobacteriales bacterium]